MINIKWIDGGRWPQHPPNPAFPHGIDVDMSHGASQSCQVALPYPATRCGMYVLACDVCGLRAMVTTAGRIDDPRSARVACRRAS